MLATELRLIRLGVAIRLRRLGWWPWLLFVAWVVFAAGQEPGLLRGFGIYLSWQGGWSGATILLLCLTGLGPPPGRTATGIRYAVTEMVGAGVITVFVAVAHALIAGLIDGLLGSGASPLWLAPTQAFGFTVVWLPTTIATVLVWSPRLPLVVRMLVVVPVGFSLAGSTLWFSDSAAVVVAASLVATVGAGSLVAALLHVETTPATSRTPR